MHSKGFKRRQDSSFIASKNHGLKQLCTREFLSAVVNYGFLTHKNLLSLNLIGCEFMFLHFMAHSSHRECAQLTYATHEEH